MKTLLTTAALAATLVSTANAEMLYMVGMPTGGSSNLTESQTAFCTSVTVNTETGVAKITERCNDEYIVSLRESPKYVTGFGIQSYDRNIQKSKLSLLESVIGGNLLAGYTNHPVPSSNNRYLKVRGSGSAQSNDGITFAASGLDVKRDIALLNDEILLNREYNRKNETSNPVYVNFFLASELSYYYHTFKVVDQAAYKALTAQKPKTQASSSSASSTGINKNSRLYKVIMKSDDANRYADRMYHTANDAIRKGLCTLEDIEYYGGFVSSTSKKGKYFMDCQDFTQRIWFDSNSKSDTAKQVRQVSVGDASVACKRAIENEFGKVRHAWLPNITQHPLNGNTTVMSSFTKKVMGQKMKYWSRCLVTSSGTVELNVGRR
jgi:hypothetical protein